MLIQNIVIDLKGKFLLFAIGGALLCCSALSAQDSAPSNCAAAPYAIEVTQPDASKLSIIGKGTAMNNWMETEDGYVVQKLDDGRYVYYGLPNAVLARNPDNRTEGEKKAIANLQKHFRPSANLANPDKPHDDHSFNPDNALVQAFPSTGKRKYLVLLIQYPDRPAKYTKEDFEDLMQKPGGRNGTGSFRDFFLQASYGKLDIEVDVVEWTMADSNEAYYANKKGKLVARELVAKAIMNASKLGVDFSKYDNDGDKKTDGILVVHSGLGAEEGSQNDYIWSHRWDLAAPIALNGVSISSYTIVPEQRKNNTRMVGIGVICHEFGHLLGIPDLYDTKNITEGVGNWSLMAGGAWTGDEQYPTNFDPFSKIQNGWVKAVVADTAGLYKMRPGANDSLIYRLNTPEPDRYFLLEARFKTGVDRALPGEGLAIWRIDDSTYRSTRYSNMVNSTKGKFGIELVQADGKNTLGITTGNRGDAGDLYPGSTKNTSFGDITKPSSKSIAGVLPGFSVYDIKTHEDTSATFLLGGRPIAAIEAYEAKVCANFPAVIKNSSQFATAYEWHTGDGKVLKTKNFVYQYTQEGLYTITLKAIQGADTAKANYTVEVYPELNTEFEFIDSSRFTKIAITSAQPIQKYIIDWGDDTEKSEVIEGYADHHYDIRKPYRIKIIAIGENCSDTVSKLFTPGFASGIVGASPDKNFFIYPNPNSEGRVRIHWNIHRVPITSIRLYDMSGRPVQEFEVAAGPNTSDYTLHLGRALASGVYLLQIESSEGRESHRLIIQ